MLLVIKNLVILVELFGEKLASLSFLEFSSPFPQLGSWVHCLRGYSPFTVPSKWLQT